MTALDDVPIFYEWVALIQADATRAQQQFIHLQVRNKRMGFFADPALQLSIEDYQSAQTLLAADAQDSQQVARVEWISRIGQATRRGCPDRQEWRNLIRDDASFAAALYGALGVKQAMCGLQTPRAILASIAAYDEILAEEAPER